MIIFKLQISLLSPQGLEMTHSMWKIMIVAAMYPASRIVVKLYTRILDNTIIENNEVLFIQMQCDIGAFKRFDLIINYCSALNICLL